MFGGFPSRGESDYDGDYESSGSGFERKEPMSPDMKGFLLSLIFLGIVVALMVRSCW